MHSSQSVLKIKVAMSRNTAASCLALLLCMFALFIHRPLMASDKTLSFGIVPQQTSTKLAKKWVPLINLLNRATGYSIIFSTAPDIPAFEERLNAGEYDLAYMNPYHYTVYHDSPGYNAFAKQANKKIKGILVARADTEFQNITDLNNKIIAFPAPAAFAATLLARSHLDNLNITYTPKFVSSHDSVYRAVSGGFADAGGGIYRTLYSMDDDIESQLKVIWESSGFTPHAFASHQRLDASIVSNIQDALINLSDSAEGKLILNKLKMGGIQKAQNSDWDDVRKLNIRILQDQ